ncbi:MAG: hypothetical protein M3O15_11645, partial [Acidobacteriota bacterium]|nr:hypothetical protein [Acidobacteriota bacterium]
MTGSRQVRRWFAVGLAACGVFAVWYFVPWGPAGKAARRPEVGEVSVVPSRLGSWERIDLLLWRGGGARAS